MKFQVGFCPKEALTLLSLCTKPINETRTKNLDEHTEHFLPYHIRRDWESIATESSINMQLSFELGKHASGSYYLLFRTANYTMQNIHEDLEFNLQDAVNYVRHPEAQVHKSFLRLFESIKDKLSLWMEILSRERPIDLFIGGHGRSAAVATLGFAWLLQQQPSYKSLRVKAYLFGCPKVGNHYFSNELNERYDARNWCYNIRHSRDLIPFIPFASPTQDMGSISSFKDVGNLVLLKGAVALQGTTLMGTFSKHRAQWYAHYLKQQFQSSKRLGFFD